MRRVLIVSTACALLASCATKQLVPDYATFSAAYARDMNWQMLLNLARLDQGHPAYFMAIGEIRLGRTQSASLNTSGSSSHTTSQNVAATISRTAQNVLSGTVSPAVSASANPTFVFIPINSEEAAKQLLAPISIDVFNTLYQQGWPVDQLLRVLVERIEVEEAGGNHLVLSNSPTRGASPDSFTRFLRACDVVRELQKRGGLQLLVEEVEAQSAAGLGAEAPEGGAATRGGAGGGTAGAAPRGGAPVVGAGQGGSRPPVGGTAGTGAKPAKSDVAAETRRSIYRFSANRKVLEEVLADFAGDPRYLAGNALDNFRGVFQSTLTVGSGTAIASAQDDVARRVPRSTLVLRSFRNVIDAVAQEQRAFDALTARNRAGFFDQIPVRQQRPVLRTDWSGFPKETKLLPPVATLSYAGHAYQITDEADRDVASLDARWNRDVFRLLIDLSSQVTVDITKFQRQVLQLTQ